jgi:Flp pilus assembly protein TadG
MNTNKPRGSIFLFTVVLAIPLMLVVAGVAVDVAMLFATRSQLHRSMDAAALAGAGKLRFDDSVDPVTGKTYFALARDYAVNYAGLNPYNYGSITLNRNDANVVTGDVVLGVYNGTNQTFTVPPCDITSSTCKDANGFQYQTMINAVRCRTTQNIPTYFLKMVGLTSLSTSAESVAISDPPMLPPQGACIFPIGVSACPFLESGTYGSAGCGAVISFITANSNTSGWVNLGSSLGGTSNISQTPSANTTRNELSIAAGGGGCAQGPLPQTPVGMNGGMDQSVMDDILGVNSGSGQPIMPTSANNPQYFLSHYGGEFQVHNFNETVSYDGPGWQVYVPVVYSNNNCNTPENMNQAHTIATYAKIVIVQVINHGWCGVANHAQIKDANGNLGPNPWDSMCPAPNGTAATRDPNLRAIFAFYDCGNWQSNPVIVPAPRAALGDKLRLVRCTSSPCQETY